MSDTDAREQALRVARWICEADRYARAQDMQLVDAGPGWCELRMPVREDMLNGVGMTHGAVTFGLADVAFAVASNSHGQVAVALTATISYPAASSIGDNLTARARERSLGRQTASYEVEVTRADGALVGLFSGTVFRRADQINDWMARQPGDADGA